MGRGLPEGKIDGKGEGRVDKKRVGVDRAQEHPRDRCKDAKNQWPALRPRCQCMPIC